MTRDLLVRRVYRSYGIDVVVELDFVEKTVSLVDKTGKNKSWLFAGRTPEYLNGWRAILKAMDYAVEHAAAEMDLKENRDHEEFAKMYAALDKSLTKGQGNPDEA